MDSFESSCKGTAFLQTLQYAIERMVTVTADLRMVTSDHHRTQKNSNQPTAD